MLNIELLLKYNVWCNHTWTTDLTDTSTPFWLKYLSGDIPTGVVASHAYGNQKYMFRHQDFETMRIRSWEATFVWSIHNIWLSCLTTRVCSHVYNYKLYRSAAKYGCIAYGNTKQTDVYSIMPDHDLTEFVNVAPCVIKLLPLFPGDNVVEGRRHHPQTFSQSKHVSDRLDELTDLRFRRFRKTSESPLVNNTHNIWNEDGAGRK